MNPTFKKLTIFSLVAGIGQWIKMKTTKQDNATLWRIEKLIESSLAATDNCKITVDERVAHRVQETLRTIYKSKTGASELDLLLFALMACEDLYECGCRDVNLEPLIKRINWCTQIYDPRLDHFENYFDADLEYHKWLAIN